MTPPSWQKLLGSSAAAFLVIGAFLAGRVNAGSDPALKTKQARTTTQAQASTQARQQQSDGFGFDDGTGSSSSSPQQNPPTTQAS